jgi:hypothetical protein
MSKKTNKDGFKTPETCPCLFFLPRPYNTIKSNPGPALHKRDMTGSVTPDLPDLSPDKTAILASYHPE